MTEENVSTAREKFLNAYANLPLTVRNEIVVVLGEEPMTWNAVFLEVSQDSEKGKIILSKLKELKII
ncbi:MAG: hypothetical protein WC998_04985 [Candidatus Paceibacterota bacterium]|jgi:hypothetical protein